MDCSCTVYVGDCDNADFHSETSPVAKKIHTCSECNRIIHVGEKYSREFGIWDGRAETFKICHDCLSIRDQFFKEGWFYGQIIEDLNNYIVEVNGDIPSNCLIELTKPARDNICDMIEKYWEEN